MKNYRKYILWCGAACCLLSGEQAAAMTCDVVPDCVALGFKVPAAEAGVTCKNKTRMKCPFGDYYFCSENICNGYLFDQTCESGDICGEACTDSKGTHYSGTSCSSAYKYEEVGINHNIGADLTNRDEHCSFLKGSRCFLNDFVATVVGTDCVPCSEKGYPVRYDLNKYEYIYSLGTRVCIDKTQSYWFESDDTRLVCKKSAYPYTSSNCSGTLSGSTCSDSNGTHYKECIQACDTKTYPYMEDVNCSLSGKGKSCKDSNGWHYEKCESNCDSSLAWSYARDTEGCIDPSVYCRERDGTPVFYRCPSCMECYEPYGGHCSPIYNRDRGGAATYDSCTAPNGKTFYCATSCPDGFQLINCACYNF